MRTAILSRLPVLKTISQLPAPWRKRILYGALGVGLLLVGLLSGAAMNAKGLMHFGSGGDKVPIYIASDSRAADPVTLNAGFAPVAKAVTPAVVTVQISSRIRRQQTHLFDDPSWPFDFDPFRDFFFRRGTPDDDGSQTPRRQTPRRRQSPEDRGQLAPSGLGSGVIVSPDGYWNLPQSSRGVVITDVDPDSGAADAGLQRGDVIEEVNRQPVASPGEFEAALKKVGNQSVLLRVRRGDHASFVVVKPRE